MKARIDPEFRKEILKYGADNFSKCYNCGNCTAVCNLTETSAVFPRIFIRKGLLGLKDEIIRSRELWLCYGCGDCSDTCPRQADPGAYMAALRRYAIARYDISGIAGMMFRSTVFMILFTLFIAVLMGFFLLTLKPENVVSRWIFQYIPYDVIHHLGIGIFIVTGISILAGIIRMFALVGFGTDGKLSSGKLPDIKSCLSVIGETGTMKRHRTCDAENDSPWHNLPFYRKPWFVHYSIMWGFLGLLLATILDFFFKDPSVTTWWPARILGTVAGLFLIYGTTVSVIYRLKKITGYYAHTHSADWIFLIFLWLAGITGFWMEISVTFNLANRINETVFLIHTVISMELVLLFALSKFAHAVYRPLALTLVHKDL